MYRIHILYQLKTNIATECNVISYHIISYQGIHHVNCGGCQVFWFLWEAFLGYSLPFQAAAFFVVGLSVYYFRGAPERDWERVGLWQTHKWHSDEMKQYANTCKSCKKRTVYICTLYGTKIIHAINHLISSQRHIRCIIHFFFNLRSATFN